MEALILTLLIELLVAYVLGFRSKKELIAVALVSCFTNPLLNYIVLIFQIPFYKILFLEFCVVVVEYGLLMFVLRRNDKKVFLLSLLMNGASFLLGILLLWLLPNFEVSDMMFRCRLQQEPVHCLETQIEKQVNNEPQKTAEILAGTYNLWPVFFMGIDRRAFSDSVHEIGMVLSYKYPDVKDTLLQCDTNWKQACMHGIVMEKLDMQKLTLQQLLQVCDEVKDSALFYTNCMHGVGHMLWAKSSKEDINDILSNCPRNTNTFSACVSGVLMEYSKDDTSQNHSHKKTYSRSLPCKDLQEEYHDICFIAEASYRQYSPGVESFSATDNYCKSLGSKLEADCRYAVNERKEISGK